MLVQSESAIILGPLVRVHRAGADVWVALVLAGVLGVAGLILLLIPLNGQPLWSIGMLILAFLLLRSWWRKKNNEVRVHEGGFLYRRGGALHAIRWTEVSRVWQHVVSRSINFIPIGTFYEYTLETCDGTFVLNGELARMQQLGEEIQLRIYQTQIAPAVDALNHGETIAFGPIQLSSLGLTYSEKFLSWSKVRELRMRDGDLLIVGEGKWMSWATVSIAEIPNFVVFRVLSSECLKNRAGA
jgi:uncharacterized protein DUF6585